jgi:glycosyltransferase involved in cell wall biosynthesis
MGARASLGALQLFRYGADPLRDLAILGLGSGVNRAWNFMIHAVMPYGREGSCTRVRVFEWLDRIRVPVVVSSYLAHRNSSPSYVARHPVAVLAAERRLRRMASARPQRLLLHREASPLSRGDLERRLLSNSEFAVYDFDDALQWDWGAGGLLRRLAPKAPKALIAVQHADRVIAGSPVLAEWASQHNEDVVLIPSCVSPASYRQKADYQLSDPPRLGWIGSPDNETYLQVVAPALREVHRRTGARLTLISTTRPSLGDMEGFIDRVRWSEATQHARLAEFDLGIAPLADDPHARGKCGYKLLQYAAVGIPAVGSPIGVNREILSRLGMPAAVDSGEWVDAIVDLLSQSAVARATLGRRAREVTQLHYSYDAWLPRWKEAVGIADTPERA